MNIRFIALDTPTARALQRGGTDANNQSPKRAISNGGAIPCRHCQSPVAEGEEYLILSHRPFSEPQPYAESGPIFLHARECSRAPDTSSPAAMYQYGRGYILRGYDTNDWIKYDAARTISNESKSSKGAILDFLFLRRFWIRHPKKHCEETDFLDVIFDTDNAFCRVGEF